MNTTYKDLEKQIEDSRAAIRMRDLAIKLHENPEFKEVILKGFCVDDCARYAQLSADPSLSTSSQADALAIAQAAGHLRRYLSVLVQMGNAAERAAAQAESEMEIMRAEGEE